MALNNQSGRAGVSRRSFLAVAAGVAVAGCRPTPYSDVPYNLISPQPGRLPSTQPGVGGQYNIQRAEPPEFKGDLLNPHIGTATFQRFNGDPLYPREKWDDAHGPTEFAPFNGKLTVDHYPQTTLAYCRWIWSIIEPAPGQYRWDIIENSLNAAAERGQTLQLRLEPYGGGLPVPDWYWKTGAAKIEKGAPDSNDSRYRQHWGNLIRLFGQRFDGHPALESFDVAYAGACGETGGNAKPDTARDLVDIYLDALPKTQLVTMLGTPGCIYAMKLKRPIGWRVDCFGDIQSQGKGPGGTEIWNEMYDAYPRSLAQAHAGEQWKIAPVTLETCWTVGAWVQRGYDLDWILEQGLKYHASVFMPKSCAIPEKAWDKVMAFNRRLGYRFVVRQMEFPKQITRGRPFHAAVWIDNVGIAPIYRPYKLALRFTQPGGSKTVIFDQDIRKWLPDGAGPWFSEKLVTPPDLQPGLAQIDMGIIDAAGIAKVKLSNTGTRADNWQPMGTMQIV